MASDSREAEPKTRVKKMANLIWVSEGWLVKAKQDLVYVNKGTEESPNPNYLKRLEEIRVHEVHLAEKKRLIASAIAQGWKLSQYEGTCKATGETVKPLCGFVRKNELGKWETFSRDVVFAKCGLEVATDLPEVPA
jgi:hypothetical protein